MVKQEAIQNFVAEVRKFQQAGICGEDCVQAFAQFGMIVPVLSTSQKHNLALNFIHNKSLIPLYNKNFTIFLQFYCGIFPLPPMCQIQPQPLQQLFKSSASRYQLLQLQNSYVQLPIQQQLYIGFKIVDCILQIKSENDQKLYLFKNWYLVLLQIVERAVKYAIEKANKSEIYLPYIKAITTIVKHSLSASKTPQPQLLHCPYPSPTNPSPPPSPLQTLHHYSLQFLFQLTQNLVNLQHHKQIEESCCYQQMKRMLRGSVERVQEVLENYVVMGRGEGKVGVEVGYNVVGVVYFLCEFLEKGIIFTAKYKLRLILPILSHSLHKNHPVPRYHKYLITYTSHLLLQLPSHPPISNLNEFMFPLDHALTIIYDYIGGIQHQEFQDLFIKGFKRVCNLMDEECIVGLYGGMLKLSFGNDRLLGHLLNKLQGEIDRRLHLPLSTTPLLQKGIISKLLTPIFQKKTFYQHYLSSLTNLLSFLHQRSQQTRHQDNNHVLSTPFFMKDQIQELQRTLTQEEEKLQKIEGKERMLQNIREVRRELERMRKDG